MCVAVLSLSLEKHPKDFMPSPFSRPGLGDSDHVCFPLLRGCMGRDPIHTFPAWHMEPPGPAGRVQTNVLGNHLPSFWMGAGCQGERLWSLIAGAWMAA